MMIQPNMPASLSVDIPPASPFPIDDAMETIKKFTKTPKFHHTFKDKRNGRVGVMDSRQPARIWNNVGTGTGYVITDGKLVHGVPKRTNNASYLEVELDNNITYIGARIRFPDIANAGSVALCSFSGEGIITERVDKGGVIPDAGIHVTFGPNSAGVIVFSSSGSSNLGTVNYDTVTAGVEYPIALVIDESTLYVVKPDGTISQGFTDPRISSKSSRFATFELYEFDTTKVPAEFVSIWADDTGYKDEGNTPNIMTIIRALGASTGDTAPSYTTVDAKGYGTQVTDMNSAAKTGFYYCNPNAANAPGTAAYYIFTQAANSSFAVQYAWHMGGTNVYRRNRNSSTWDAWALVDTSAGGGGGSTSYETIDINGYGTVVTDANTASKTGFYYCSTNASNAPGNASYFFFTQAANSSYAVQYAWQLGSTNMYKRNKAAGTWDAWTFINNALSLDTSGNSVMITDFNNANTSGYYQCNPGASNAPGVGSFHCHVISANSNFKIQLAWDMGSGARFKRIRSNGTWGSWAAD